MPAQSEPAHSDRPPTLYYDDVGAGAPLLLVHAFPLHGGMWRHQLSALSGEARCLVPDLPGFGRSAGGGPWTVDRFADDLARVLDDAGVARATVCGLSLGGYVALALWRRHPDRVRALILADTRAGADSDEGREKRRATIELAQREGAAAVVEPAMTGLIGRTTRERHPEIVEQARTIAGAACVEGIVGASEAMRDRPDATPLLETITVPSLVIVGEEDALTPVREARMLVESIPDAQLEIIPGAGHLSSLERPAAFTCAVRDFVATLPER